MELRCDNIQYSIEGSRILNGISLGVSNNEFHTILGPNGCGKTTFLKTVYRITKPDLGAIYLDGKPLDNISIRKSAQNMAVVAQFNNLNFDCSVLDVVMLGRTPHLKMMEQEKKEDYEIAYNALKSVGMYEKEIVHICHCQAVKNKEWCWQGRLHSSLHFCCLMNRLIIWILNISLKY